MTTKISGEMKQFLPDEKSSILLAQKLSKCIFSPLVLAFSGPLGAGKTTMIRALLRALGITAAIKSPSFSLVESYVAQNLQIHHFDLYRIQDDHELDYLGFRDYFSADAICCIEWPEKAEEVLLFADIHITLAMKGAGREMLIEAFSASGSRVLACLTGE